MANFPKLTVEQVIESFRTLAPEDRLLFIHEIFSAPFRKALEAKSVPDLLSFTQAVLGLESLDVTLKKLAQYNSAIGEAQEEMRANMARMGETTKKTLEFAESLNNELGRRTVKPRNTERDKEIVRLHDQEGKSFGEIGKLLSQKDSVWRQKSGSQLTYKTIQAAYRRQKTSGT